MRLADRTHGRWPWIAAAAALPATAVFAGLGWGLAAAAGLRGIRSPALGATVHGMLVGNAGLHVAETIRARRYTPGFATAAAGLGPVGIAALVAIARHPRGGARPAAAGAAAGIGSGVVLLVALRSRM